MIYFSFQKKIDKLTIKAKKNLIYVKGIEERLSKAETLDNNLDMNIDVIMGKLPLVSTQGITELDTSINDDKDLRERFVSIQVICDINLSFYSHFL